MIIRAKNKKDSSAGGSKIRHTRIYAFIIIVIMLSLSGVYLHFAWNRYQDIASSEAVMLAQSLESLLHSEHIAELSGTAENIKKSEYGMAKQSLTRLVETTDSIHFAYLMGERDGSLIFLMDSESPDSPDYSPPGQVYTEASDVDLEPFISGKTVLTDPTTDRWGTWISAMVPVKDSAGEVIAVFGIDYSAQEWYLRLWENMVPDIVIVVSVLGIIFALLRILFQHNALNALNKKLAMDEELYHSVFDQAPIGIAIVNDKSFVTQSEFGNMNINPMFERILGRTSRELASIKWPEITHPDDLQADLDNFELFKLGRINGYSMEKRFLRPDGSSVWTNMKISALSDSSNKHSAHLCLLEDISVRKETEKSLRESERSKSVLISNLPGMAYRCNYDREWTMHFVSDGCYELTGYAQESLLYNKDLSFNDLISNEYRDLLWREWKRILSKKLPFKYEYEIITAKGERKWVLEMGEGVYNEKGEVEALEGIILDISERKKVEDQLRYNSEHDTWTGLYNRRYLENILRHDADLSSTEKRAVVSVNLSAMHLLSLTYGFNYSQDLMKKAADALKTHCSGSRQLFNTYEYRFVFYVKAYEDKKELTAFCEAVAGTISSVLSSERISGGIGVVEIDEANKGDVEQLLKNLLITSEKAIHADESDYCIRFFGEEMIAEIVREESISRELVQIAAGDNDGRLFLQYQPVMDLESNKICGFEALARLNSYKFGRISPLEFIPVAEKTKLIIPLGEKIIFLAFGFLRLLEEHGYDTIFVSINISAIQLLRNDFVKNLFMMIDEMRVNPANIELEITESILASNYEKINGIIRELGTYGIKVAIDDFGTGYSSLDREQELNVNCLKIDKNFIDKLLTIKDETAIAGDIISMAHKLGHCVVAEGVESEKQRLYLKKHGCDRIQGNLVSQPLGEEAAIELLKQRAQV